MFEVRSLRQKTFDIFTAGSPYSKSAFERELKNTDRGAMAPFRFHIVEVGEVTETIADRAVTIPCKNIGILPYNRNIVKYLRREVAEVSKITRVEDGWLSFVGKEIRQTDWQFNQIK